MAGRGRGRGRSNLSFNVEELGFGRGEALPSAVIQPPPLFPPLAMKPAVLLSGEKYDYLAALKQEFRGTAVESPFHVKVDTRRRDVQRYSDKYQQATNGDCDIEFKPDWRYIPTELHPKVKSKGAKPNLKPKRDKKIGDITTALSQLEEKERTGENEEEEEKEEEQEQEEEVVYDEEDEEEETDYLMSYFDNGENYMDEEDDNLDDEATY